MQVRTYLLVHTEVGRAADVARTLEADLRVLSADTVSGAYDVIAQASVAGYGEVCDLSAEVRAQPGVTRLLVCPVEVNGTLWEEILTPALAEA